MSTQKVTVAVTVSNVRGMLDCQMMALPMPYDYEAWQYASEVVEWVRATEVYQGSVDAQDPTCYVTVMVNLNSKITISEQFITSVMFMSEVREFCEEVIIKS
jgi:hypothetical protein